MADWTEDSTIYSRSWEEQLSHGMDVPERLGHLGLLVKVFKWMLNSSLNVKMSQGDLRAAKV